MIIQTLDDLKKCGNEKLSADYFKEMMGFGHSFEAVAADFKRWRLARLEDCEFEVRSEIGTFYEMQEAGWIRPETSTILESNKEVRLKVLEVINSPGNDQIWTLKKEELETLFFGDEESLIQLKGKIVQEARQSFDLQWAEIELQKYDVERAVADKQKMMDVDVSFKSKPKADFEIKVKAKSRKNNWIEAAAKKRVNNELNHGREQYWRERYEDDDRQDYSRSEY